MVTPVPARLDTARRLTDEQVGAVLRMVEAVAEADGVRPLSEHVLLHLRYGGDVDVRHVLAYEDDELVGYAHMDVTDLVEGSAAELAVHPQHRRHGIGRRLVERLLGEVPDGRLRLWAHGQHPGAAALARRLGFVRARVLWQMRRTLAGPLPEPVLAPGIGLRAFVPGRDEAAWTALNNRAFAAHPDQGHWTVEDVLVREREPWFDPAGFLLAVRAGRLVGFHWTKVHGGGATDGHPHEPIGEVYIVGVDPAERGTGLGRALTLAGLRSLRARGLAEAMLYVDETNTPAIGLYESLGFTRSDIDVSFAREPPAHGS